MLMMANGFWKKIDQWKALSLISSQNWQLENRNAEKVVKESLDKNANFLQWFWKWPDQFYCFSAEPNIQKSYESNKSNLGGKNTLAWMVITWKQDII